MSIKLSTIQGKNFIKTVLNHYKNGRHLKIVEDQYGCPTYTQDLVQQTVSLLKNNEVGLFHAVNRGVTNWYQLTVKLFEILEIKVDIKPIKTEDFPALAKRPSYSVLENYHLNLKNLNLMREWQIALKDFLLTNRKVLTR
ncbi:MAG: dTDP-4-dehydrorhamnose reductase [candidate division WS2 bacterium]|nr:dTDP-4-dehydrorhamnose reductase [Candidatus Psychracetigena formicireducens]